MYNRKYQEVKGPYWVYVHQTPDKMCYFGYSGCKKCYQRWQSSLYNNSELKEYIDKYGWDNIKHIVIVDEIKDIETAKAIEDYLITDGWKRSICLNKKRSGSVSKNWNEYYANNRDTMLWRSKLHYNKHKIQKLEYAKTYRETHKEHIQKKQKEYREANPDKIKAYQKEYYNKNKEKIDRRNANWKKEHPNYSKEKAKESRSTIEGKIYTRVTNFNRTHPNEVVESPKEAKRKYLEYGYIPKYIKNNDLKLQ